MTRKENSAEIKQYLQELRQEYHTLEKAIECLRADPESDQLLFYRSKRRKIELKAVITKLESQLIPDLDA
ncbi:conserved hypothetical protein [Gammaproteobacteria bacterium]